MPCRPKADANQINQAYYKVLSFRMLYTRLLRQKPKFTKFSATQPNPGPKLLLSKGNLYTNILVTTLYGKMCIRDRHSVIILSSFFLYVVIHYPITLSILAFQLPLDWMTVSQSLCHPLAPHIIIYY